jgi:DNA repair exonuclease SbcCD ATPase subunit
MITLKTLEWSNAFSYGENNRVDFNLNPLTQIVGYNGHGKSSIALILEEVLYNKNSKGIKKADVLNRNAKSKSYSICLTFDKDGDHYEIKTVRSTTQSVKLLKNGEDISSHTATQTYKTIEDIVGYDHKTFAQIVYQSSASSLEFLTATDGNRKKFLIDLLNLSKYVEAGEVFKQAAKEISDEITVISTKIKTNQEWFDRYSKTDLSEKTLQEPPLLPKNLMEENSQISETIKNIETTNKKIIQNNKYKELMDGIVLTPVGEMPDLDIKKFTISKIESAKAAKDAEAFIQKMSKLGSVCPTCLQDIDKQKLDSLVKEHQQIQTSKTHQSHEFTKIIQDYEDQLAQWKKQVATTKSYEEYYSFYNPELQTELLDKKELESTINSNNSLIREIEDRIVKVTEHNTKATAHNARIDVIKTQLEEVRDSLVVLRNELKTVTEKHATLQVLVKTFSSTGLVAYKIECLVKDLEEVTNKYLSELSGGRFQLAFKISSSDKLLVVITDHGKDIEILALSGGERARVNCAALLGIRKLMQSLSNTRINLLILDETIENLDVEGKEKLVEVLLQEEYLNTFLISHGFSHPLLEKVQVIKKNNVSRIEHG